MITKYENKSLKLNFDLAGKKKGSVIQIQCDKVTKRKPIPKKKKSDKQKFEEGIIEYIPIDLYWRDRLKDAKMDNCVEFVDDQSEEISDESPTEDESADDKSADKKSSSTRKTSRKTKY